MDLAPSAYKPSQYVEKQQTVRRVLRNPAVKPTNRLELDLRSQLRLSGYILTLHATAKTASRNHSGSVATVKQLVISAAVAAIKLVRNVPPIFTPMALGIPIAIV